MSEHEKILIIGNTSEKFHIGSIMTRAAEELQLNVAVKDCNFSSYAPSMKVLWGKAFFKLAGKRPLEWWSLNKKIINTINQFKPRIILVTGILPLAEEIFKITHQLGIKIINYLTDDPWNHQHFCLKFLENLKKYDLILSTKSKILPDLAKHGVKASVFLPFAYDPFLHYQPDDNYQSYKELYEADICFIGTGDTERLPHLKAIASLNGLNLKIYGGAWQNISIPQWQKYPAIFDNQLRLAIYYSKLSLGIVRKRNRDESTLRTFEIAACGGCGIYEDTHEHREILKGYPEYGFFSSPRDLTEKCNWLLKNPIKREEMRQIGIQTIVKNDNTYTNRLNKILEMVK